MQADMERCREQICILLKCTEEQYTKLQYKCGLAYLQYYFLHNDAAIQQLESSRLYWNWFKLLWFFNDDAFIKSPGIEQESLQKRRRLYKDLNSAGTLAQVVKPSRIILSKIKNIEVCH